MTFELSLFIGQSSRGNDESPHFVIFQPIYKTSTMFLGLPNTIAERESKGLSNRKITHLQQVKSFSKHCMDE